MATRPAAVTAQALAPAEAELLAGLAVARPASLWRRLVWAWHWATATVSTEQFQAVCEAVLKDLDGKAMHPEQAAAKAARLIEAHTEARATCHVAKCDVSDTAILVAFLGKPSARFWFSRSFKLIDPRKARK